MALLWIDGFDTLGVDGANVQALLGSNGYTFYQQFSSSPPNCTLTSNTVDNIGFALNVNASTGEAGLTRNFPIASSIVIGVRVYLTNTAFQAICQVGYNNGVNQGNHHFRIFADGAGGISITKGSVAGVALVDQTAPGDLLCNSGPNVLFENTWQYLEIKFNVGGNVVVKVDGTIVLPATAVSNPQNLPSINLVSFINGYNLAGLVYIDDLVIMDQTGSSFNNNLGDCVVRGIMPNADAGTNTFTQIGGGSGHFTAIDEIPPDDDTSYLTGNTSGEQEMFTLPTFPGDVIDVLAVSLNIRTKKDSAGYATYEAAIAYAGTTLLGAAKTVNSAYVTQRTLFTTTPSGGVWSTAIAQAMSVGLKLP